MEEGVRKELDEIQRMVLAWKESYLGLAASDGPDESMARDFLEEIESHVHPYVMRMYDCNYLSQSEVVEFLSFCHDQVEALRVSMRDAEADHPETIWPEGREKETFSPH